MRHAGDKSLSFLIRKALNRKPVILPVYGVCDGLSLFNGTALADPAETNATTPATQRETTLQSVSVKAKADDDEN